MNAREAYEKLKEASRHTARLEELTELASWDQRTMLPPKGHPHRAEQLSTLALIMHERTVDPRIGELLSEAEADASLAESDPSVAANLREWRRTYDRAVKIPSALTEAWALAAAEGETAWEAARAADDWSTFSPFLEKIFTLAKEKADAVGYEKEPYDALIEDFEPGETAQSVSTLFSALKPELTKLIEEIGASSHRPDRSILTRLFPKDAQETFSRFAAAKIGFDFDAGRLDISTHPFTAGMGIGDARITTRYNEHFLPSALFGTLHEAGHGMYEQGLPAAFSGEPRGHFASLGIHESQSRLWENLVGRSEGFWRFVYPTAQETFESLKDVSFEDFFFAINDVKPDLIRVEADEVTYNLHIILRFELESALLRGDLAFADLPEAWSAKMAESLGVRPTSAADGVLQDVHWSAGLIGYFPTYTLGNVYAAQIFDAAEAALGDQSAAFAEGNFAPILGWLRENIHERGSLYRPRDLVAAATGTPPTPELLIHRLRTKYGALFHL